MSRAVLMAIASAGVLLSGCSTVMGKTEFGCKAVDGVGCVSTEAIDRAVVSGNATEVFGVGGTDLKVSTSASVPTAYRAVTVIGDAVYRPMGAAELTEREVLVLNFAPYVDSNGNYHDASTMRTVISHGRWK